MSLSLVITIEHPTVQLLAAALEGLVRVDVAMMPANAPPVTVMRYEREPAGREDWQTAQQLLRTGRGDCEDLACYHAAWLRRHGEHAYAVPVRTGPRTFHIVVLRADGTIDDPSRWGGM